MFNNFTTDLHDINLTLTFSKLLSNIYILVDVYIHVYNFHYLSYKDVCVINYVCDSLFKVPSEKCFQVSQFCISVLICFQLV